MTNEENALSVSTDAETVTVGTEDKKPEGMSNRGALELALQDIKASEGKQAEPVKAVETPEPEEQKAAPTVEAPKFQPPAEWDKEAKEDFSNLSPKQQEATLRLYHGRITKLSELQRASAENEQLKALSESVNPYLRAMGVKDPPAVAIQKALTMWNEIENGDTKTALAQILKAKGIEVPTELAGEQDPESPKISALQSELDTVKAKIAQQEMAQSQAIAQQVWSSFESTKNAAGTNKYPDINESESGLALSRYIGSLVSGTTDFSKQFIALTQSRIPGCTPERLLEEAYKVGGGRVDDAVLPTRSTNPQEHLKKSNRAAASIPGRGTQGANANNAVKRFATFKEAAKHALAEIREREGS